MKDFGKLHEYEDFHEFAENPFVPVEENVLVS